MNKQKELNDRLEDAARLGDVAMLAQALEGGADGGADYSWALSSAAEKGHAECVRLLIPVSDPLAMRSLALRWAAKNGHVECLKLLIPVSDPMANDSLALAWAAEFGYAECVRLLLPASNPLAVDAMGVNAAACALKNGHKDVAGMIEAFIEANALSETTKKAKSSSRVKSAL